MAVVTVNPFKVTAADTTEQIFEFENDQNAVEVTIMIISGSCRVSAGQSTDADNSPLLDGSDSNKKILASLKIRSSSLKIRPATPKLYVKAVTTPLELWIIR